MTLADTTVLETNGTSKLNMAHIQGFKILYLHFTAEVDLYKVSWKKKAAAQKYNVVFEKETK